MGHEPVERFLMANESESQHRYRTTAERAELSVLQIYGPVVLVGREVNRASVLALK